MENASPENQSITPEIDFGLCYAGDMAGYLKFDIPFDYYPPADYGPMRSYIDTKVFCFINEIHDKYRRMGYFTAPFYVRCTLRGHDNRDFYVSKPQLMTAGLLPPCLDHYSFPEYDRIGMHFTLKGSPCFKLLIRMGALPEGWAAKVKCVDIYVSPQVKVWRYGGGHRCDYSDVLRSIKSDQSIHEQFDAGEFVFMCKGRYCKSEFSPIFQRHYNDAKFAKTPVWYVRPNNDLIEMLADDQQFYNIASIDAAGIIGHKSFHTIGIRSTLNYLLEYLQPLDEIPENIAPHREDTPPGEAPITRAIARNVSSVQVACARPLITPQFLIINLLPPFTSGLSPPQYPSPKSP